MGSSNGCRLHVMDLIDSTRSIPHNIQEVQQVFGVSYAFARVTQHLSKAVGMVTKSVLKEHMKIVASIMTCTGNLHGFNSSSYKATFQSMKAQAPFMDATLSGPLQCFQKSAEELHSDQLDSIVSSCSWGNHAGIGTGSAFEIHWNNENRSSSNDILEGCGLYDFLTTVETIGATEDKTLAPHGLCLYDVDQLPEDDVEEDEVVCLEGNSLISWTNKPKPASLQCDFDGTRTAMHITAQEHQGTRNKSNWNSVANWKNDKPSWRKGNVSGHPHSAFAGSTSISGCNKRRFTGQVFERKQPNRSWSSSATHQNNKPSWFRTNVVEAKNSAIAELSGSGGWNRKTNTFGQGGGRAVWKSEGSLLGGSNTRNWKAQQSSSAQQGGSSSFTPVEQHIYAQVEPIMKNVKRIIHESRDGIKLSPEDEMFIVSNVLMYHPEKEKKMAGQGNYIMVTTKQLVFASEGKGNILIKWVPACRLLGIKNSKAAGVCMLHPQTDPVQISPTRNAYRISSGFTTQLLRARSVESTSNDGP